LIYKEVIQGQIMYYYSSSRQITVSPVKKKLK